MQPSAARNRGERSGSSGRARGGRGFHGSAASTACWRLLEERLGGQGPRLVQADPADHPLDLRELVGRHPELAAPQPEQEHPRASGSPPIVPQTLTSSPRGARPRRRRWRSGGGRPRSAAEYRSKPPSRWSGPRPACTGSGRWCRSRKNPPRFASWSAMTAAARTSDHGAPTGQVQRGAATPSAVSSAATSFRSDRAWRNSARVETSGNIARTSPRRGSPSRIARSCAPEQHRGRGARARRLRRPRHRVRLGVREASGGRSELARPPGRARPDRDQAASFQGSERSDRRRDASYSLLLVWAGRVALEEEELLVR